MTSLSSIQCKKNPCILSLWTHVSPNQITSPRVTPFFSKLTSHPIVILNGKFRKYDHLWSCCYFNWTLWIYKLNGLFVSGRTGAGIGGFHCYLMTSWGSFRTQFIFSSRSCICSSSYPRSHLVWQYKLSNWER